MQLQLGKPKKKNRLRRTAVVLLIVVLLPMAFFWLINQQWLLTHILRTVNFGSDTKIALSNFTWNPITSTIELKGLGVHHVPLKRDGWVESVRLCYRPLGFLRGKFIIRDFSIEGVNVILPTSETEKKRKHRRLNISRLLLLHSLIIEKAQIDDIIISFGKDSTFRAKSIGWSLDPSFTGDTTLVLEGDEIYLHKAMKEMVSAEKLSLKTSTRLSRWYADFPYINAMLGKLTVQQLNLQKLPIDDATAELSYQDSDLELKGLKLAINGNELIGSMKANIDTQEFNLDIDIPKPIHLPYIGKKIQTLNTEGDVSGHIELEGKGLVLRESSGKGRASLIQRFSAALTWPVDLDVNFSWGKGRITISDGRGNVDDGSVTFDGSIDVSGKKMKFTAMGQRFPIEAFFEIFTNPHLKKIYGVTDFSAEVDGWGKGFVARVQGNTFDGGFKPLVGQRIETDMTATYNKLEFAWKIFQENRQTGSANLVVAMGPKTPGADRRKTLDLDATLKGHDLEPTLPGFNLTGRADGTIKLTGPHTNFTGTARAKVVDGSWLGVAIKEIVSDIDLTRPKLTFRNIELTPAALKKIVVGNPLVMDLPEGKLRLHGDPLEGLAIALTYTYDSRTTNIEKISYDPPERPGDHVELVGHIVSGGGINLAGSGRFDLALIEPLGAIVREASGLVEMNLRASGTSASPALNGTIVLNNDIISPRAARLAMDQLTGTIRFDGHRIYFDDVKGLLQDGAFTLGGWLEHREYKLSYANLQLLGQDLSFRTARNTFRMEFDGKLTMEGAFPHPLLAGDINILDGRYTKDFVLLEQIGGGVRKSIDEEQEGEITFDPKLNLNVHNTGDLLIRNNVGDIDLQADITITGTRTAPKIVGAINTREGKINYLGLGFEITRGFIEFRDRYGEPYLEVEAQRELRLYNLRLRMYGRIDNLRLDLEGSGQSGALEKRDIVSLLTSGATEQERREGEGAGKEQLGVSVAAQQVGQMLERPISEATHLDIFRIEAAEPEDTDEPGKVATRLRVGKQITDRLSVDFSTDIDTRDAEQTVTTEYLVTDNLILKGSRGSDSHYRIRAGLQFRMR